MLELFLQYKLREIPGTGGLEHGAAKLTHYALYGFMTIMPASGIAMGYFGGESNQWLSTCVEPVTSDKKVVC